jgi:hypothetical protein
MGEVDRRRDSLPLLEIKYEDLCRSPDTETGAVSRFLGLDTEANASNVLVPRVAAAERSIHSLAGLDAALSRAEAWRTELTPCQILAIEWMTTPRMKRRGYDAVRLPAIQGAGLYFCLVMTWIGSLVRNVIHAGRVVRYYATNWTALAERVRQFRLLS